MSIATWREKGGNADHGAGRDRARKQLGWVRYGVRPPGSQQLYLIGRHGIHPCTASTQAGLSKLPS